MQTSASFSVKGPIEWMVKNAVSANLIMLACIFGGYLFIQNIKQEVFPQFQIDAVKISVAYPGASPEEIETGIILAIEDAISGVDGIDEIRSSAQENMASVFVDAMNGVDTQILAQDLQQQIDRITTFPEDAEAPQITVLSIRRRGLTLALYGETSERVLHEIAEQFRDRLIQDEEITQVELNGVRPLEISIEVNKENLRRYHLTIGEIAQRIGKASIELPGGSIKTESGEILIRMKTRKDYGQDFARIPIITTADGTEVLLAEIASITDGYEDNDYSATYNGKPAVLLQVYSVGEQTPIQISQAVQGYIQQINQQLPKGIKAEVLHDSSKVYQQRIDLLLRNSAMGLILVFITLSLFLELRLAFWVMMGIPIAFLGSFLILPSLGVTLNMISLFAFIIALGIVVDDAIIIGENIYHYRQEGLPPMQAAIKGTQEMAVPVTFSILTNIATFMPLFFMPGVMGKIFFMIPAVVITVFLLSLAESLFILPNHLAHLGPIKHNGIQAWIHQKQQVFSHAFRYWVNHRYGDFLESVLNHRYLTMVAAFSLLALTLSYAGSGRMGMTMFPKTESDFAKVTVNLPYGSAIDKTNKVAEELVKVATQIAQDSGQADQLVKGIFADIGITGSHKAVITVYLTEPHIRNKIMSTEQFAKKWRTLAGDIAGVDTLIFESDAGGPGAGSAITIELNHSDLDVLETASKQLADALRAYPMVKDVDDGFSLGKQQYDFSLIAEGKSLGLDELTVGRQVRDAFYGAEVLRQQRGRNEVKVMVRLPKSERSSTMDMNNFLLWTDNNTEIPVNEVVKIQKGHAYTEINRRNGRRNVQVKADVTPRNKAGEIINDLETTELAQIVKQYPGLQYSFQGRQADMAESVGSLKLSFVFALLAIYAMLAIPFQSYILPLIVIISIPFGIIGAIFGHLIMGYGLSILSMLGIVALSGIVVNDSLVLINHANHLRTVHPEKTAANVIKMASIQRFRPIILTTMTTFFGLMPMILETSRQAKILIPMAISIGFGIVFATLITLILIPSLYLVVDDLHKKP